MNQLGQIDIIEACWKKYSNRLFPKYEKKHWVVWMEDTKAVAFRNFELAHIYSEVIKLTDKVIKLIEKELTQKTRKENK